MKHSREKIFHIKGLNIDNTTKGYASEDCLHVRENLSKYVDVISIGDSENGFDYLDLRKYFVNEVNNNPNYLNIIFDTHGGDMNGNFMMSTNNKFGNVPGESIFEFLVYATSYTPLKILVLSCHAELLQKLLYMLPKGSMLITIANNESNLDTRDLHSPQASELLRIIDNNGEFRLENLLSAYCLNQKAAYNDPVIGIHDKLGYLYKLRVSDFVNYKGNYRSNNEIVNNLFRFKNINEDETKTLLEISNGDMKHFIIYNNKVKNKIKAAIQNNELDVVASDIITMFYHPPIMISKRIEILKDNLSKDEVQEYYFLFTLKKQVLKLEQKASPESKAIEKSLQSAIQGFITLVDEDGKCYRADEEFKNLFRSYLNEFLNSEEGSYLMRIRQLKENIANLEKDSTAHKNLDPYSNQLHNTITAHTKISHFLTEIGFYGLLNMDNPEGILNHSILLTLGSKHAIGLAQDIFEYEPTVFQILTMQILGSQSQYCVYDTCEV